MGRLLKYLLILGATAFVISYLLFAFINYGLRKQKNDSFGVINELVGGNSNYDVLFIGSSLSKNNIDPFVFDSVKGSNSYNFGFYGAKINHSRMMVSRYLHSGHPAPKEIILLLEPYILDSLSKINFPIQYYPYYEDTAIYNYVSKYDPEIKLIKRFPFIGITKYNDYLKSLGLTGVFFPGRTTSAPTKGFEPLNGSHIAEVERTAVLTDDPLNMPLKHVTKEGLQCLEDICKMCLNANVRLVFVMPPTFLSEKIRKKYDVRKFEEALQPFLAKYNVTLLDHTGIDLCKKGELFFDGHHLNKTGAGLYTRILANAL